MHKMLSIPRALCVKSWLKTSLKIGKIPIFTPLQGSEVVKSKKQRLQTVAPMVPIRPKMEQLKKKKQKLKMKKKEMKKKT